jgi:hypothetical protein
MVIYWRYDGTSLYLIYFQFPFSFSSCNDGSYGTCDHVIVFLHVPDNELRGRGPLRTLLSEPAWLGLDLWANMVWCFHMSPTFYSTCTHVHCHIEILNRMSVSTRVETIQNIPLLAVFCRVLPYLSGATGNCAICNLPLGYVTECRCALAQQPRR